MNATEVAKKLVNVIGTTQSGGHPWQPYASNPPNANWLTKVYLYFAKLILPLEELKAVPLVPGNDGKLYEGGFDCTPLWCDADIDSETIAAVQYFGVNIVKAPPNLEGAIALFADRHQKS